MVTELADMPVEQPLAKSFEPLIEHSHQKDGNHSPYQLCQGQENISTMQSTRVHSNRAEVYTIRNGLAQVYYHYMHASFNSNTISHKVTLMDRCVYFMTIFSSP